MISENIVNANTKAKGDQNYKQALNRLFWLRNIALISQLVVVALVVWWLQIKVNILALLIIIFSLGLVNLLVFLRLKRKWNVSKLEIAIHLTLDILALAALLYFAGGSTNPLVSLFIIPVALSAVFLPIQYIVWMVLLTASLYTLLMEWYIPLPSMGSRFGGDFNLHVFGMYGNFIFSAIIIAVFIYTLARASRKNEQALALAREKIIRDKYVVETGLIAANAAHEINTPLSTIGLLAEELLADNQDKPQTVDDVKQIQTQVRYCKKQLQVLQQKASLPTDYQNSLSLQEGIVETVDNWSTLHPEITVHSDIDLAREIQFPQLNSLMQTLVNLMDNAADASLKVGQTQIKVTVECLDEVLVIDVDDFGNGLSEQQLSHLGRKPYTSKPDGMGIGLLLSHTSLDHLGGHILLNNRSDDSNVTGIRAKITLPLLQINS